MRDFFVCKLSGKVSDLTSLIESLVPESVKKLIPYQSARRIGGNGRIWLNANELEAPLSFDSNENRQ